jgi:hypothetical protein
MTNEPDRLELECTLPHTGAKVRFEAAVRASP